MKTVTFTQDELTFLGELLSQTEFNDETLVALAKSCCDKLYEAEAAPE